jgi:hypothetical protein
MLAAEVTQAQEALPTTGRLVYEQGLDDVVQRRACDAEAVAQTQREQDFLGLRRNDNADPPVVPQRHRLAQHRPREPVRRRRDRPQPSLHHLVGAMRQQHPRLLQRRGDRHHELVHRSSPAGR